MSHTASAKTSGRDVGARWLPSMSVSAVAKTWFAARRRWFRRCARARPRRDIRHPIADLFTGRACVLILCVAIADLCRKSVIRHTQVTQPRREYVGHPLVLEHHKDENYRPYRPKLAEGTSVPKQGHEQELRALVGRNAARGRFTVNKMPPCELQCFREERHSEAPLDHEKMSAVRSLPVCCRWNQST